MTARTTMVTVTVGRITREVEADAYGALETADRIYVTGVVATIGQGAARYPDTLTLRRVDPTRGVPAGCCTTRDSVTGALWSYHLQTCVRNRQARIVAWADVAPVTNCVDQTRLSNA